MQHWTSYGDWLIVDPAAEQQTVAVLLPTAEREQLAIPATVMVRACRDGQEEFARGARVLVNPIIRVLVRHGGKSYYAIPIYNVLARLGPPEETP